MEVPEMVRPKSGGPGRCRALWGRVSSKKFERGSRAPPKEEKMIDVRWQLAWTAFAAIAWI